MVEERVRDETTTECVEHRSLPTRMRRGEYFEVDLDLHRMAPVRPHARGAARGARRPTRMSRQRQGAP